MSDKYLTHISGMKGLGALFVLIHHYFYCYYPLFLPEGGGIAPIEWIPGVNLLVNGNFAVCLFLILSGFLVARSAQSYDSLDAYGFAIVKRYFRLMIPLLVASVLSYLLCVFHLYRIQDVSDILSNELTDGYFRTVHFHHLLLSGLFAPFGYAVLVGPFWMMKYILLGSFLVWGVMLVVRKLKPRVQIATILFIMLLCVYQDVYYACVLAGMLLLKMEGRIRIPSVALRAFVIILLMGAALWLAAAQKSVMDYNAYMNSLAAFLFVLAVLLSNVLTRFFGCRFMDGLGRLSLGVYIFHWPLICSLSCWMFMTWPIVEKWMALSVNFIVTLAVVLFLAHLYNRWVERRAVTAQNRLSKFF